MLSCCCHCTLNCNRWNDQMHHFQMEEMLNQVILVGGPFPIVGLCLAGWATVDDRSQFGSVVCDYENTAWGTDFWQQLRKCPLDNRLGKATAIPEVRSTTSASIRCGKTEHVIGPPEILVDLNEYQPHNIPASEIIGLRKSASDDTACSAKQ